MGLVCNNQCISIYHIQSCNIFVYGQCGLGAAVLWYILYNGMVIITVLIKYSANRPRPMSRKTSEKGG